MYPVTCNESNTPHTSHYTHTQPIDTLENTLLGKYGTSTYQNSEDWGEEEEEHSNALVKRPRFDGFMPRQRRVGAGAGAVAVAGEGSEGSESSGRSGGGAVTTPSSSSSGAGSGAGARRGEEEGKSALARLPVNEHGDHEGFEDTYGDGGMDDDDGYDGSSRYVPGDALIGRTRGGFVTGLGVGAGAGVGGQAETEPSYRLRRPKVDPRAAAAAAKKADRRERAQRDKEKRKKSPTVEGKWEEFR